MKILGFILALMFLSLQGWTQGNIQYFNILNDYKGKGYADWAMDALAYSDSTYVIAGNTQDSVYGAGQPYVYARPYFLVVSEDGNIVSKRDYARSFEQLGGISNHMFVKTPDHGFAIAGEWERWDSVTATGAYYGRYLLKLDSLLDSTWISLDSGSMVLNRGLSVQKLLLTQDGGYLVAGETYNGRLCFAKFDDNGAPLWNKTIPFNSGLLSMTAMTDGGFFLTGWKNSYAYVCKLDSACDIVWERTYDPTPGVQNSSYGIPLADGGFFFLYGLTDNGGTIDLHFSWMDSTLSIYHEETLFMEFDQFPIEMIELTNHSIIVSGRTGDRPGGDNSDRAFMLKFSPQHEILWLRKYYWWYGGSNVNSDCALAHDGGFILTGSSWDTTGTSPYQDSWILKVDSIGCPYPNCGPSLAVNPTETNEPHLIQAYPNPASDRIRLRCMSDGLHEISVIRLLTIDGKVMDEVIMPMGFQEIGFDVSRFAAGVYFWEYRDEIGRREAAKFEVVR